MEAVLGSGSVAQSMFVAPADQENVFAVREQRLCVKCGRVYTETRNFLLECPMRMHACRWSPRAFALSSGEVIYGGWPCCGAKTKESRGCVDVAHSILPYPYWEGRNTVYQPSVPVRMLSYFHAGIDDRCYVPNMETVEKEVVEGKVSEVRLYRYDWRVYRDRAGSAQGLGPPSVSSEDPSAVEGHLYARRADLGGARPTRDQIMCAAAEHMKKVQAAEENATGVR